MTFRRRSHARGRRQRDGCVGGRTRRASSTTVGSTHRCRTRRSSHRRNASGCATPCRTHVDDLHVGHQEHGWSTYWWPSISVPSWPWSGMRWRQCRTTARPVCCPLPCGRHGRGGRPGRISMYRRCGERRAMACAQTRGRDQRCWVRRVEAGDSASYTTRPPISVSTLRVAGSAVVGTVNTSCESTARSASIPGASVPVSRSANSA